MLCPFNRIRLFVTPWTVARWAPLSLRFSRQESWSALPWPPPGDLPDPRTEPTSLMSPALAGGSFTIGGPWEAPEDRVHGMYSLQRLGGPWVTQQRQVSGGVGDADSGDGVAAGGGAGVSRTPPWRPIRWGRAGRGHVRASPLGWKPQNAFVNSPQRSA